MRWRGNVNAKYVVNRLHHGIPVFKKRVKKLIVWFSLAGQNNSDLKGKNTVKEKGLQKQNHNTGQKRKPRLIGLLFSVIGGSLVLAAIPLLIIGLTIGIVGIIALGGHRQNWHLRKPTHTNNASFVIAPVTADRAISLNTGKTLNSELGGASWRGSKGHTIH